MNTLALALDTGLVEVGFYDDVENTKLLAFPTASKMLELVSQPMEIPKAEFLT